MPRNPDDTESEPGVVDDDLTPIPPPKVDLDEDEDEVRFPGDTITPVEDVSQETAAWARRPTTPRYQPPADTNEILPQASAARPRYRVPGGHDSTEHPAIDTSPFRFGHGEHTPPRGSGVVEDENPTLIEMDVSDLIAATADPDQGLPAERSDAVDESDLDEVEVMLPSDLNAPPTPTAATESATSGPRRRKPTATLMGLEGISPFRRKPTAPNVHSALTVEMAPSDSGEHTDLKALQGYLDRLTRLRPGAGGMGGNEAGALERRVQRVADVRLAARTSLVLLDGRIKRATTATVLPSALVECLASTQQAPLLLVGGAGSGKSHALASLASAMSDTCLLRSDDHNAFDGLTVALAQGGLPIPLYIDLAAIATIGPTKPSEFIATLVQQQLVPKAVIDHDGPVVIIADNLELALALGHQEYDPYRILSELLEARQNWRAVVASRPMGRGFLSYFSHYGATVPVVEIDSMKRDVVASFVNHWNAASGGGIDPDEVVDLVPAAVTGSPRLLQLALGQWNAFRSRLDADEDRRVSNTCALLLDALGEHLEKNSGSVGTRNDLQVLAEAAAGTRRRTLSLQDTQELERQGFLRNALDTLTTSGALQMRVVRGDRAVAETEFTHPLFLEVLQAESSVGEILRAAVAGTLAQRARELNDAQVLAAFDERQVLRILEVGERRVRALPVHLLHNLSGSLEGWLANALDAAVQPATRFFPRMIGVCWLLAGSVRHVANLDTSALLDSAIRDRAQALLSEVGEDALCEAIVGRWAEIHSTRTSHDLPTAERQAVGDAEPETP